MRFSQFMALFLLCLACACNSFATDKKSEQPENKPHQKLEDAEFHKLRKQQDSLLEMRQKKTKPKGLDTLKPKHA